MIHHLRISARLLLMVLGAMIGMAVIGGIGLSTLEQNLLHDRKIKTKHLVDITHDLLGYYATQERMGILSESDAKRQAMNSIRQIRYGEQDYFWINDLDHKMLMHPFRPELEGTDVSGIVDPTGKHLFREFVTLVKKQNSGFVDYYWPKPNSDTPVPKVSYVKGFKPWNWVIGSGIYIDDVNRLFKQQATIIGSLIALILSITLAVSLFIGRGISKPLESVSREMRFLVRASGNHKPLPPPHARSEIEELEDAIDTFKENISQRREAEEKLRKLSQAVEQSPASVVITDLKGNIEYVNEQFAASTGYSVDEVLGKNARILNSGRTHAGVYKHLWDTIKTGGKWQGEFHNRRKDGSFFWEHASISPIKNRMGVNTHYLAIKEDITLRKDYEKRLLHQENFDQLTDLPNRILARDRLSQALRRSQRDNNRTAVLYIDLDDFKKINDTHSHEMGDDILKQIALRLKGCVRDSDTIARMGGDGFLMVLQGIESTRDARNLAQKVNRVVKKPLTANDQEFFITASVGISIYPTDGEDSQIMMRNADAALYMAKEHGRDTYRFFTPELNLRAQQNLELETELHHALERKEFSIHYQPLLDVAGENVVCVEALLRWNNATLGSVRPDQFIPTAEHTGLIIDIGNWVIQEACTRVREWSDEFGQAIRLAVNISSRQFLDGNLVATVERALRISGLPAQQLEMELTESLLMDDKQEITDQINRLKKIGARLSIDDFGTGYSSLSYLRRYPFDVLKIDRSFVQEITTNEEDAALSRAITAMAHSLNLEVVAEGVETKGQLDYLRHLGCDIIQGYYFSKPLPEGKVGDFLKTLASPAVQPTPTNA